jgi:membrane associated rhomboid family serine protease
MSEQKGVKWQAAPRTWVVVLEGRSVKQAEEASFVLRALGIEHQLTQLESRWQLSVPAENAAQASEELESYRAESRLDPQHGPVRLAEVDRGWAGVAGYAAVVLMAAIAANQQLFGAPWVASGRLEVDRVLAGEWWRPVTALTLHVDAAHLASNLVFGGFFGLYAGRYLGSGLAWLCILAGGTLGNALNALIQPAGHRAVGASTAVFAALGLLAAYTWRRGFFRRTHWKRRVAPLTAALGLLAFLGTGGGVDGQVDIMAHLTGFLAGLSIGALLAGGDLPRRAGAQRASAGLAAAILIGAWVWALAAG